MSIVKYPEKISRIAAKNRTAELEGTFEESMTAKSNGLMTTMLSHRRRMYIVSQGLCGRFIIFSWNSFEMVRRERYAEERPWMSDTSGSRRRTSCGKNFTDGV
jgi:hypothetical protein